jgi:hypothetical protein
MKKRVFFGLGILATISLLLVLSFSGCKKELGATDIVVDPEQVAGERYMEVIVADGRTFNAISTYRYTITTPDGTPITGTGAGNSFKIDLTQSGKYSVIVTQDGYIEGKASADVEIPVDKSTSLEVNRLVLLTKYGQTKTISSLPGAETFEQSNIGVDDNQYITLDLPANSINGSIDLTLSILPSFNPFNGIPIQTIDVKGIPNTPVMYIQGVNKSNPTGHIDFANAIDITFPITFDPSEVDPNNLYLVSVTQDGVIDASRPDVIPFTIEQTRAKFRGRAKIHNFSLYGIVNGFSVYEDYIADGQKNYQYGCGTGFQIDEYIQPIPTGRFPTTGYNLFDIEDLWRAAYPDGFHIVESGVGKDSNGIPLQYSPQLVYKRKEYKLYNPSAVMIGTLINPSDKVFTKNASNCHVQ